MMEKKAWILVVLLIGGCSRSPCGISDRQACVRQSKNYSALLNCFDKLNGGPQDHEGKHISSEVGYPTTLSR